MTCLSEQGCSPVECWLYECVTNLSNQGLFSFQDAEKMEKAAKRINELETINNNVKVLEDMLKVYSAETSQSDKDMMRVGMTEFHYSSSC